MREGHGKKGIIAQNASFNHAISNEGEIYLDHSTVLYVVTGQTDVTLINEAKSGHVLSHIGDITVTNSTVEHSAKSKHGCIRAVCSTIGEGVAEKKISAEKTSFNHVSSDNGEITFENSTVNHSIKAPKGKVTLIKSKVATVYGSEVVLNSSKIQSTLIASGGSLRLVNCSIPCLALICGDNHNVTFNLDLREGDIKGLIYTCKKALTLPEEVGGHVTHFEKVYTANALL